MLSPHPPQWTWSPWLVARLPRQGRFPFRSPEVIERAQQKRIAAAVRYAYGHVPYYRQAIDRIGLAPADIKTAADLARLPLIERTDLQRDLAALTSRARPLTDYVPLQTGGSTGTAITVYHDRFALVQAG